VTGTALASLYGMAKRHVPHPGYFKVSGGAVEENVATRRARLKVSRDKARLRRRAGRKGKLGEAPVEQHAAEHPVEESVTTPPMRVEVETPEWGVQEAVESALRGALELTRRVVTLPFAILAHLRGREPRTV
jgi:hypothetical protein